ncbi:MAG: hypothetical protein H7259_06380 [Cytophagales bacterium]|nr:hypothetical protein [Cytophaga sp.]
MKRVLQLYSMLAVVIICSSYSYTIANPWLGKWKGTLTQFSATLVSDDSGGVKANASTDYLFEMDIKTVSDISVSGETKITLKDKPDIYGIISFSGIIQKDGKLAFEESRIIKETMSKKMGGSFCLKNGILKLDKGGDGATLSGSWAGCIAKTGKEGEIKIYK